MPIALRALLPAVLAAPLLAADPQPLLPPAGLPEFQAGGSLTWSTDPEKPSLAEGGVTARYEGVRLAGDRLTLLQTVIPGSKVSAPAEADLLAGPKGPTADRVELDTRQATLPTIGFKGLLTPLSVSIRRQPPEPARASLVRWHVDLPGTGDFNGQMKVDDGWALYRGWAERAELELSGTLTGGKVGDLRVTRITLHSRAAAGDVPARTAEINRLTPDAAAAPPTPELTSDQVAGHIDAQTIIIDFDALGRPGLRFSGRNNIWGDPRLFSSTGFTPGKP